MNKDLKTASFLANLLDNKFQFAGMKFGIDAILQLIPGFGDGVILLLSFYIIAIGIKMKIPFLSTFQMVVNVGFSFLIGLIPFLGDAAYLFYKPNIRNLRILEAYNGKPFMKDPLI